MTNPASATNADQLLEIEGLRGITTMLSNAFGSNHGRDNSTEMSGSVQGDSESVGEHDCDDLEM